MAGHGRAVAVKDLARFGRKRTCASCSKRFYDFGSAEATCPSCGTVAGAPASFDVEDFIALDDEEEAKQAAHADVEPAEIDLDDDLDLEDADDLLDDEEE